MNNNWVILILGVCVIAGVTFIVYKQRTVQSALVGRSIGLLPERTDTISLGYHNSEEIEFPEGFNPVTFMPRKIVIHRNVVPNG